MATIGLVVHHEREKAAETARRAAGWLLERGHQVRLPAPDGSIVGLGEYDVAVVEFSRGVDLAVSLGGDGTILRTVDMVSREGVPVLGISIGQLGYLAEVDPDLIEEVLERYLAGEYLVEERLLLSVVVEASTPTSASDASAMTTPQLALNEAVLEKTAAGHTVRLSVSINGRFFTT